MPEVMEAAIFDPGGCQGLRNGLLGPPEVALALAVGEHKGLAVERAWPTGKERSHCRGHRHVASFPILAPRDGHDSSLEVHIAPTEPQEFSLAESRVEQDGDPLAALEDLVMPGTQMKQISVHTWVGLRWDETRVLLSARAYEEATPPLRGRRPPE